MTDTNPVDLSVKEIALKIQSESDTSKYQDLLDLFNWNLSKKQINRVAKLDELFDDITDQMITRFKNKPDQFSNDDLLNYMKAVQGAIDNNSKNIGELPEAPKIINNTQINVNVEENFDRESRARILAAIQATLKSAEHNAFTYEDKTEGDNSDES